MLQPSTAPTKLPTTSRADEAANKATSHQRRSRRISRQEQDASLRPVGSCATWFDARNAARKLSPSFNRLDPVPGASWLDARDAARQLNPCCNKTGRLESVASAIESDVVDFFVVGIAWIGLSSCNQTSASDFVQERTAGLHRYALRCRPDAMARARDIRHPTGLANTCAGISGNRLLGVLQLLYRFHQSLRGRVRLRLRTVEWRAAGKTFKTTIPSWKGSTLMLFPMTLITLVRQLHINIRKSLLLPPAFRHEPRQGNIRNEQSERKKSQPAPRDVSVLVPPKDSGSSLEQSWTGTEHAGPRRTRSC
jgi:hypothetical protein